MTSEMINKVVEGDLDHIPKHPKQHQSELRMTFAILRKASLGKNATGTKSPGEVMRESVASVLKNNPGATLMYDEKHFA